MLNDEALALIQEAYQKIAEEKKRVEELLEIRSRLPESMVGEEGKKVTDDLLRELIKYGEFQLRLGLLIEKLTPKAGGDETLGELIAMLDSPKYRQAEGRRNCLAKLAAEKARDRLGMPSEYEDGTIDQPFLTPDTVRNFEYEDKHSDNS